MGPVGYAIAAGTGAFLVKPVFDAVTGTYRYIKPSESKAILDLQKAPLDAKGNPIIDDDLERRLSWSGADDQWENLPGGIKEYLKEQQLAGELREAESAERIRNLNPMNRLNEEFLLDQKRDLLEGAKHRRAQETSNNLYRQSQERWQQKQAELQERNRIDRLMRENRVDLKALDNQALQITGDQSLALAQLAQSRDRNAWERGIYEDQLARDEEQRIRDQRKFYALLGQSVLSEGLKAFF